MRNLAYITVLLLATSCSKYQKLVKDGTPVEKLEAAKKYYADKDYVRSQALLEELLGLYYGKKEREEIYYLFAYSHYGLGEFLLAGYHFNYFAQTYTKSPKREEASYMSAECKYRKAMPHELDQTQTTSSINALQAFINQYPNSKYVSQCNQKIDDLRYRLLEKVYANAKLYHSLGYYRSAMVSCQNALDDYPDMIRREELSFMIADAAYQYADNSIEKKQPERFAEALVKVSEYEREFGNSAVRSKEIIKIKEKSTARLAELNL